MTEIKITKEDFDCLFWTQLKDYPDYEIDIYFNIRNVKSKMLLVNRQKSGGGYFYVTIKYHGLFKNIPIHTITEHDNFKITGELCEFYDLHKSI